MSTTRSTSGAAGAVVASMLGTLLAVASGQAGQSEPQWQVGLAKVCITPQEPIRMAGYASRNKPSEGVLADLYAKAMAVRYGDGEPALLVTADLIGFRRTLAESICAAITKKTGLKRQQILLGVSHTHTGPVLGADEAAMYQVPEDQQQAIRQYAEKLAGHLADLSAAALADMKPARLSWGVGVADFVMNRREFTERGVQLGVNPRGYVDRSVPVLRVDAPDGKPRAVLFGCACHNTTLTGQEYRLSGDYAGFSQEHVEKQHPGVQAMFMIGCGASANPYPRETVEYAKRHGLSLGTEVCRVLGGKLQPVRGPLRVELDYVDLPLQAPPPRERLLEIAKGSSFPASQAKRMLAAMDRQQPLPTHYHAPTAVWQFGDDLTLVGLSGEVVGGFVPLLADALGQRKLWLAAYCNDTFGYVPTAKVVEEGGYEMIGVYTEFGSFSAKAQDALVAKVRQMAEKAGRKLPEQP